MKSHQNILVAVRIRPDKRVKRACVKKKFDSSQIFLQLPSNEQLENFKKTSILPPRILSRLNHLKSKKNLFSFDFVFGPKASQTEVYETLGSILLKNCIDDGYNATIFAYGQTGSGKTFTMMGGPAKSKSVGSSQKITSKSSKSNDFSSFLNFSNSSNIHPSAGIIPRLSTDLFRSIQKKIDEQNLKNQEILEEKKKKEMLISKENENNRDSTSSSSEEEELLKVEENQEEEEENQDLRKSNKKCLVFEVKCSMIEIYNEKIKDLLCSKHRKQQSLGIREHPKRGWFIPDLSFHKVTNEREIRELIILGGQERTIASTKMNERSSRAHTIFQIQVKKTEEFYDRTGEKMLYSSNTISMVNLVDLAGSEQMSSQSSCFPPHSPSDLPYDPFHPRNQRNQESSEQRKKELISINVSLSCLGLVITKLSQKQCGDSSIHHIPYRNSKLTKLLPDSLGGTAKAIMIATISPYFKSFDQTYSTLRYASRVKIIKNKPILHQDPKEKIISELKLKIKELLESTQKQTIHSEYLKELQLTNNNISSELNRMKQKHLREKELSQSNHNYLRNKNKILKSQLSESQQQSDEWKRKYFELLKSFKLSNSQFLEKREKINFLITRKQDLITSDLSKLNNEMLGLKLKINNIWKSSSSSVSSSVSSLSSLSSSKNNFENRKKIGEKGNLSCSTEEDNNNTVKKINSTFFAKKKKKKSKNFQHHFEEVEGESDNEEVNLDLNSISRKTKKRSKVLKS